MTQYARPTSDVSVGGWTTTPLWSKINDVSDATYITSTKNASADTFEVALGSVTDPAVGTGHILKVTLRCDKATNGTATLYLYEGTTLRATYAVPGYLATGFTIYSYTLLEAEANAISSYSNLRIRVAASCSANAYDFCSEAWLEVPDASTDRNVSASDGLTTGELVGAAVSGLSITALDELAVGESPIVSVGALEDLEVASQDDITLGESSGLAVSAPNIGILDGISLDESATGDLTLADISTADGVVLGENIQTELGIDIDVADSTTSEESVDLLSSGLAAQALGEVLAQDSVGLDLGLANIGLSDGVSLSDTPDIDVESVVAPVTPSVEDGLALTDGPRYYTEDIVLTEYVELAISLNASASDAVTVSDGSEQDISISLLTSDGLVVEDSPETTISDPETLRQDDVLVGEAAAAQLGIAVEAIDGSLVDETVGVSLGIVLVVADDLAVGDVPATVVSGLAIEAQDDLAVGEEAAAHATIALSVSDGVLASDVPNVVLGEYVTSVSDNAFVDEAQELVIELPCSASDDLVVGDSCVVVVTALQLETSDDLVASEVPIVSLPELGTIAIPASDIVGLSEEVDLYLNVQFVEVSDGIAVTDIPEAITTVDLAVDDMVTLGEAETLDIAVADLVYEEGTILGESVLIAVSSLVIDIQDGCAVEEVTDIQVAEAGVIAIAIFDSVEAEDIPSLVASGLFIAKTDSLNIGEEADAEIAVSPEASDNLAVSEQVNVSTIAPEITAIDISDGVLLEEVVSVGIVLEISVADNTALTDEVEAAVLYLIEAEDNLAVGDIVTIASTDLQISVADALLIADRPNIVVEQIYWNIVTHDVSVTNPVVKSVTVNRNFTGVVSIKRLISEEVNT